jgi:hypothetical protein
MIRGTQQAANSNADRVFRELALATSFLAALPFLAFGLFAGSCHVRSMRASGDREDQIGALNGQVKTVSPDVMDPADVGRMVSISGVARGEAVVDEDLGLGAAALVLERHVSMYQWLEDCSVGPHRRRRRHTPCQYTKVWRDAVLRIEHRLGHAYVNPPFPLPPGPTRFVVPSWTVGVYRVGGGWLPEVPAESLRPVALGTPDLELLPANFRGRAHIDGGALYIGSPAAAQIGDLRIQYRQLKEMRVSVVAERDHFGISPRLLPDGSTFLAVKEGVHLPDAVIGTRRRPRDHWMNHVIIGMFVMVGTLLLYWPLRAWGRSVPGPALLTGAGVFLFVPLTAIALYACALAHGWWTIERSAAVAAVMTSGVSAALLLIASAVRELLPGGRPS